MIPSGIELSGIEKGKAEGKAETLKRNLNSLINYLKETKKNLSDEEINSLAKEILEIPKEIQ